MDLATLTPAGGPAGALFSKTPGVVPSLVRLGTEAESVERLATQAAKAEAAGFPHGVSTKQVNKPSSSDLSGGKIANKSDVENVFEVKQTGNKASHHTVVLPKPVTQETANYFNNIFKPITTKK